MDIISRLKLFLIAINMTSSQFADTCHIPRPSLSQLLNGRNKKVSDEIITKIHEAFPSLSVSWLLFGEGDMTTDKKIEISEPSEAPTLPFNDEQTTENYEDKQPLSQLYNHTTFSSDNFSEPTSTENMESVTGKRIINIVVFYDDNSFESFKPNSPQ